MGDVQTGEYNLSQFHEGARSGTGGTVLSTAGCFPYICADDEIIKMPDICIRSNEAAYQVKNYTDKFCPIFSIAMIPRVGYT